MSTHHYPSFDEIYRSLDEFVDQHSGIARMASLGLSGEGREVRAVTVTDPSVPEIDKQVALVVCGRHGHELGTRVAGHAALEWLASEDGTETRRDQVVIVVPVANPDGCVREEFHAPSRHLSEVEYNTIAALARTYLPDAIIDIHSFGEGQADLQAIVAGNNTDDAEDLPIYHGVAAKMIEGAARKGYPYVLHTRKRNAGYNNFIAGYCYDNYHTLAFGLEINHHDFEPDEAAGSGAAIVTSLLAQGNTRAPWMAHSGYPNTVLAGDFFTSIRPLGCNAAERRRSRAFLWKNRRFFTVSNREAPDRHTIRVRTEFSGYSDDAAESGFTLCCRIRGFPDRIRAEVNGEDHGIRTFSDTCSTYVAIDFQPSSSQAWQVSMAF